MNDTEEEINTFIWGVSPFDATVSLKLQINGHRFVEGTVTLRQMIETLQHAEQTRGGGT